MLVSYLLQVGLEVKKPSLFNKIYRFGSLQNVLVDIFPKDGVFALSFGLIESLCN